MILWKFEHTGFLQAVRQPPTEYDLLKLKRCVAEQPLQGPVAQHPGAESQQQDFGTALFNRAAIMMIRINRN
jgi:hypothetical protein